MKHERARALPLAMLVAAEHENLDATMTPIVIPGVVPAPSAYDGQFVQMDVVSVDAHQ